MTQPCLLNLVQNLLKSVEMTATRVSFGRISRRCPTLELNAGIR